MESENIIDKIKNFVEEECRKPTSKYGFEPFYDHFVPVVNISKELGIKKGADLEVLEISAWLHDIGSIIFGRENHHITSCEIAERKLKELNYPEEKIEKVKKCIFSHRGSQGIKPETIEGEILAEADSLDAFFNLDGLFKAALVNEKLSQEEARKNVLRKLQNKYHQISDKSKFVIQSRFDAIILLLDKGEKNGK